ncbi:MAG: hypothetical protein ABFS32_11485 [Bacteroidota bacterium]
MKKKLLIIIVVILVVALTIFNTVVMGVLASATWIYMALMVRKKNIGISHEQTEPVLAKRNLKWLKASLILSAILFFVSITSLILHNTLDDHSEDQVSFFFFTLGVLYLFVLTTAGGMFVFLKAQKKI